MRIRRAIWLVPVLFAALPPATAQGQTGSDRSAPGQVWALESLQSGFCIRFLMDSAAAAKRLPDGAEPARADGVPDLHPALQRATADSAVLAGWAPSELCFYFFKRATLGSRRYSADDGGVLLGVWSIAAIDSGGIGAVAVELLGNDWRMETAAERGNIDLRQVKTATDTAGSENDVIQVTIGKTVVTWDGRTTGEPDSAPGPVTSRWDVAGRRRTRWAGTLELRPASEQALVGALRVSGKDALAKALQASPIRFAGPIHQGGDASLRLDPR